jgi:hypothetical protein
VRESGGQPVRPILDTTRPGFHYRLTMASIAYFIKRCKHISRLFALLGEPDPHFKGFFAVSWKDLLASLYFLLNIKEVRYYL